MDILEELKLFYNGFKGEKGYIGFSEEGEPIPYFAVEKSPRPIIIAQYSIHAREYVTAYLALKHIKRFAQSGKNGKVFFIPAVNPDGIKICLSGKPLYKANARRVDLNVNFDALWGKGKSNITYPADENYIGEFPFSESETRALADFTVLKKPDATVSFHSKGEVIYYGFYANGSVNEKDEKIAERLSAITGYKKEVASFSAGGYKDWCNLVLGISAFTVEVGNDDLSHPLTIECLPDVFEKTKDIITVLTESV